MNRPTGRVVPMRTIVAIVARPELWFTAVLQAWRLVPRRRSRGHSYVEFRMHTQYGNDADGVSVHRRADDVVAYLGWCREWNAAQRRENRSTPTKRAGSLTRHRTAAPLKPTGSAPVTPTRNGNGH